MGAALRRNQFNDELVSLYVPSLNFPESWPSEAAYEVERLRCLFLDAKQAFEALRDDTPESPTPDAKGAQPEQLVEAANAWADSRYWQTGEVTRLVRALATALSECREALEKAEQALEYHFRGQSDWSLEKQTRLSNEALNAIQALAAQPPSEASERTP